MSEQAASAIRQRLAEINRTQDWLAVATGIPMRTLARRLHKVNPSGMSLDELGTIAAALGTDVVTLLGSARPAKATRPIRAASTRAEAVAS